ncbi:hypothetical protein Unana1_07873 [Umbelopsis nana]
MATLQQQPAHIQQAHYNNARLNHHPQLLEHKYKKERQFVQRQAESFLAKQQLRKQSSNQFTTSLNEDKNTCQKYGLKKKIIPDTPRTHVAATRESCLSPVRNCKLPSQRSNTPKDPVQQNTLLNTRITCHSMDEPCSKPCNRRKVSFQDMVVIIPSDDSMEDTDSEDEPQEPQQQLNHVFPTLINSSSTMSCSLETRHDVPICHSHIPESDLHQYGHIAKQFKKFGKWFS